jgi:hypothetical protein
MHTLRCYTEWYNIVAVAVYTERNPMSCSLNQIAFVTEVLMSLRINLILYILRAFLT